MIVNMVWTTSCFVGGINREELKKIITCWESCAISIKIRCCWHGERKKLFKMQRNVANTLKDLAISVLRSCNTVITAIPLFSRFADSGASWTRDVSAHLPAAQGQPIGGLAPFTRLRYQTCCNKFPPVP